MFLAAKRDSCQLTSIPMFVNRAHTTDLIKKRDIVEVLSRKKAGKMIWYIV